MLLKQLMDVYEVIDRADASGSLVKELLESYGGKNITVKKITGEKGSTDFVKIKIELRKLGVTPKEAAGFIEAAGIKADEVEAWLADVGALKTTYDNYKEGQNA